MRYGDPYLWASVSNELDGLFEVSPVNCVSYLNPQKNVGFIWWLLNFGLHSELFCGRRIALVDEIVHNQVVDVAKGVLLASE